jgi:hypothetical protein
MPWRTRYDLWHRVGRTSYLQVPGYSLTIFGRYKRCMGTDGYGHWMVPKGIEMYLMGGSMENKPFECYRCWWLLIKGSGGSRLYRIFILI